MLSAIHCVAQDLKFSGAKRVCSALSGGGKLRDRLSNRVTVGVLNWPRVMLVEGVEDSLGVPRPVKGSHHQVQCTQGLDAFRSHLYLAICTGDPVEHQGLARGARSRIEAPAFDSESGALDGICEVDEGP
jgi:hypothetical protein